MVNWVAEATEEVAERGRQLKTEAGKRRVNPDRKQLREEVAQQRSISPIHSFAHAFVLSLVHSFINSFADSSHSLIHALAAFIESFINSFFG